MNRAKFKGSVTLILMLIGSLGYAQQNLSYKAVLDTNRMLIGDQVAMHIYVTHSNNIQVVFPPYKDSIMHGIEVLANFPVDTIEKKGDQITLSKAYLLTSFDTGAYTIPESKILLLHAGANVDTLKTEALSLKVFTVAVDTTKADFKDIKPPVEVPITFGEIAPWLFGGLGFLAILALISWFIIRRLQKKPLLFISKPDEPADVIALRQLNKLKEEKLWQNNQIKLYHSRLTEILRVYIDQTFRVNALEQTSEETLQCMASQNLTNTENQSILRNIFTLADLTKFAKLTPSAIENEESLKLAEQFVLKTRPTVEVNVQQSSNLQSEVSKP